MTLVRGTTDRLRLVWINGAALGPDGMLYLTQSEQVRGEPRVYYPMNLSEAEIRDCPYGYTGTLADARRVCEWVAYQRSVRQEEGSR